MQEEFPNAKELVAQIKGDWREADLDPKFTAAFELLEVLTLDPQNLSSEHVQACRDTGLDDEAIMDAVMVGINFTVATKQADAFGFEVPDEKAQEEHVDFLIKRSFIRDFLLG